MEKKTNRRSRVKHPALKPQYNLKSRYELINDCDYLHKLSEEEKDWLNRFNEETINANFKHKGKKLYTKKAERQAIYNENNARNRDVMTRAKASGQLMYVETTDRNEFLESAEDKVIYQIDRKKKKNKKT